MAAPYEFEIRRACDGDALDQVSTLAICDKVTAEGSEEEQKLAQALVAGFARYPSVLEKAHLLQLMDALVVNCDKSFLLQLGQEGFFQTLISDEKVLSDQHFRTVVKAHLAVWLGGLSGKVFEIVNDALKRLSDPVDGEHSADPQPGSLISHASSDQLLHHRPKDVVTFQTPKLEKRLYKFLLSSYVQAGDILRTSRRVKWFSLQAFHIASQAFHLIIHFNHFIGPNGPTDEEYDEGMELDDALEELEDKIDELVDLELEEAIRSEADHKYDLAQLYQIFFSTRNFYPNGRDFTTDPVFKSLVDSDHAELLFNLNTRTKMPDMQKKDNNLSQLPGLPTQIVELSTVITTDKRATPLLNEYMQSGHNVLYQEYPCQGHTEKNPQYGCVVWVNGVPKGTANNKPSKKIAKEAAALEAAKSLLLI